MIVLCMEAVEVEEEERRENFGQHAATVQHHSAGWDWDLGFGGTLAGMWGSRGSLEREEWWGKGHNHSADQFATLQLSRTH